MLGVLHPTTPASPSGRSPMLFRATVGLFVTGPLYYVLGTLAGAPLLETVGPLPRELTFAVSVLSLSSGSMVVEYFATRRMRLYAGGCAMLWLATAVVFYLAEMPYCPPP